MLEALALASASTSPNVASSNSVASKESTTSEDAASMGPAVRAFAACDAVLFGGCGLSSAAFEGLTAKGLRLASQYGQTEVAGMVLIGEPPTTTPAGGGGGAGGGSGGCLRSEMRVVGACG